MSFEDLYKANNIVTIILTMHSNLLCDDKCLQGGWAITSIKDGW